MNRTAETLFNHTIDRFGNNILKFSKMSNFYQISEITKKIPYGKAIVLKNIDKAIIEKYNLVYDNKINFQGIDRDGYSTYLLRNGSGSPEIFNGKTFASKASIIIKNGNRYYTLLVKDKTKNNLGSIGGVCEESEYREYDKTGDMHKLSKNIVTREIYEETKGDVKFSYNYCTDTIYCNSMDYNNIEQLGTINFLNDIYGIDVIDTCTVYRIFVDLDTYEIFRPFNKQFYNLLFHYKNIDKYGNYTLSYCNNNETEFIHAIHLNKTPNILTETNFNDIFKKSETINLEPKMYSTGIVPQVNNINQFYNLIHYGYLRGDVVDTSPIYFYKDKFVNLNLITKINSIYVKPFTN